MLKSITVRKTPTGKYFAGILFEYEQVIQPIQTQQFIGLYFSMKELEPRNYTRLARPYCSSRLREQEAPPLSISVDGGNMSPIVPIYLNSTGPLPISNVPS